MATQQLLKIVYPLYIKFWVRWCICSMWRMLLPYYLLFIISILFLKTNIRTLNTFKDWARSPCNGNHCSSNNWRASEASETLSGVYNWKSGIYILWYVQFQFIARACHMKRALLQRYYVSVLEFVSIESYLKAISSNSGSNIRVLNYRRNT